MPFVRTMTRLNVGSTSGQKREMSGLGSLTHRSVVTVWLALDNDRSVNSRSIWISTSSLCAIALTLGGSVSSLSVVSLISSSVTPVRSLLVSALLLSALLSLSLEV